MTKKPVQRLPEDPKVSSAAVKKPKRTRLQAEQRREQILASAARLFSQRGFHGTKTREIADDVGVNEATLFLYFDTKEAMFLAAITEPLRELVDSESRDGAAFASAKPGEAKMKIGREGVRRIYQSVAGMAPLLIPALFSDLEKGQQTYQRDIFPMMRQLTQATKLSFGLEDDEQGEFIALSAFSLCFSMYLHYRMMGIEPDIDKVVSRISTLLVDGAYGKSGHP